MSSIAAMKLPSRAETQASSRRGKQEMVYSHGKARSQNHENLGQQP